MGGREGRRRGGEDRTGQRPTPGQLCEKLHRKTSEEIVPPPRIQSPLKDLARFARSSACESRGGYFLRLTSHFFPALFLVIGFFVGGLPVRILGFRSKSDRSDSFTTSTR